MPLPENTVENYLRQWSGKYTWPQGGGEWSEAMGGAPQHWNHFLPPRIQDFPPARVILDIVISGYNAFESRSNQRYCRRLS
jgi:hypothetical protein